MVMRMGRYSSNRGAPDDRRGARPAGRDEAAAPAGPAARANSRAGRGWVFRFAFLAVLGFSPAPAPAQVALELAPGPATFRVFLRSSPVGFQRTDVRRSTETGWIIESRGDLSQPLDIRNQAFRVEYDFWLRPEALRVAGVRGSLPFSLVTTFAAGTAAAELDENGQRSTFDLAPPPDAVVLFDFFFGGYEALAWRLGGSVPGAEIPVYVAPRTLTRARVDRVGRQHIETRAGAVIEARVHGISFLHDDGVVEVEVWTDPRRRLLRVYIPQAALDLVRDDITGVGTRVRTVAHAGDEAVSVRSEGFGLAATITAPVDLPRPRDGWPAVLLVSGPGAPDRDGTFSGVPVLGQLAVDLADAGFLVARYDRRGTGRSGGRPESAGVEEYGEDARRMVRYLDDRDDVDRDRITVVGHAEGGWPAIVAAARERRADNLVLIGAPGTGGAELVLEQQRAMLDRMNAPDRERNERIGLQRRIIEAVRDEGAWDGVPDAMRRQADTYWFRSFLDFDVADALRRTRQPLLILHGSRDTHVGVHHAQRLAEHARRRRRGAPPPQQAILEGLDHRLLAAGPDASAADTVLTVPSISPSVVDTLTRWLNQRRSDR